MHNYIDFNCQIPIVRKGAVRANKDEVFILPFNMRDGVAICVGKGNEDWNCTAPHGAGRKMSRAIAKKTLNVDNFQKTMADAGVYTTTADATTLDEAPDAYKPKDEIIENIKPTCDILYFMKPKINIKAAE
jgi:RNA-splicing ligase RtcB